MGFRPFIYRLATFYGLKGSIENRNWGVMINTEGEEEMINKFLEKIVESPPQAAIIKSIEKKIADIANYEEFLIAGSRDENPGITEISPDIAVCPDCIRDLTGDPYRINYPFTNCTNCGPRFTIIEDLPYDRDKTSMSDFPMCPDCLSEYNDVFNRRFHAQPVACNNCGPVYTLEAGENKFNDINEILKVVSGRIMDSKAVAVKGMGGYNLICNALDNKAVSDLRLQKKRDAKPFAVMFRDILAAEEYCEMDPAEYHELVSWRRPVVILKQKKSLCEEVSQGLGTIGAILPYLPFHYMLFSAVDTPALIYTSGNLSDEPIIIDDSEAREILNPVAGALLPHNRRIVNRADDPVIRIINGKPGIIRRARGYVPSPVDLGFNAEGILAFGAELKNTFCMGRGDQALMSQYIGDLKNMPTFDFFKESLEKFRKIFRFDPRIIACDLHPDYLSSVYAAAFSDETSVPLIRVQHHHAHIASCMAEHRLDQKVIGISFDGTGYGLDGNTWGSEFLVADMEGFERHSHFDYIPLPGGDKAAGEPWRSAYSFLWKYLGNDMDINSLPCFRNVDPFHLSMVREMLEKGINTPLSSGAGRLFDAVSALLGFCTISGFDSEAPMRLESAVIPRIEASYPFEYKDNVIIFKKTIEVILQDAGRKSAGEISSRFHNTIAAAVLAVAERIREERSISRVVISGGVFQNKYLAEKLEVLLKSRNFDLFTNNQVPSNDGGISLGQLAVASKTL